MGNTDLPLGLPLWDGPCPEEPAHGLLLRLAEINAYGSVHDVERETGLNLVRLRHGKDLELLARIAGRDLKAIAADSFVFARGGHVRIRHERVALKRDLLRKARRACPRCLADAAHHRFWWDLAFIGTCPRHGCRLVDHCSCSAASMLTWKDGKLVKCRRCRHGDVSALPPVPAGAAELAADAYLLGRLGAHPPRGVPVLDGLPLIEVIDVLDRVGALALGGFSTAWQDAASLGRPGSEVRGEGFAVLAEGRLPDLLERVYAEFLRAGGGRAPALTTAYGWFYHWLNVKGGRRFSPLLAEMVLRHADERFGVDPRARVELEGPRPLCTLVEAARLCGQNQIVMRRILEQHGLIRTEKRRGLRVRLDRAEVERIADILRRSGNLSDVRRILGTGAIATRRLIGAGLIVPFARGGGAKHEHVFILEDVHALLERLADGVPWVAEAPDGGVGLSVAAHDYVVAVAQLCRDILDGRLRPVGRLRGGVGLGSILISREDALAAKRRRR